MAVIKYPESPAMGIAEILRAFTPSLFTGWTLRIGRLVPAPDKVVAILDTGGVGAEPGMNIDYPTVQVLIRGDKSDSGYKDSYAKAAAVRDALLGIPSGPTVYPELTSCTQRGHITSMGYDDKDRPLWSLNFALITEPTIAGYREVL